MSQKTRGLIVFVAVLITILLWAPISGRGGPREGGGTINQIHFGLFRYLVIHSEIKDPKFELSHSVDSGRMAMTAISTALLWTGIALFLKRKR